MLFNFTPAFLLALCLLEVRAKEIKAVQCTGVSFSVDAINAALSGIYNDASSYVNHIFGNKNGDKPVFKTKSTSTPFYEFPILTSGSVYTTGDPGPYRVVVDNNNDYIGVMEHDDLTSGKFAICRNIKSTTPAAGTTVGN